MAGWPRACSATPATASHSPIWAHTSPVYLKTGAASPERAEAASWFDDHIDKSLDWVTKKGKFYTDSQRKEVLDLFKQGQAVYRAML